MTSKSKVIHEKSDKESIERNKSSKKEKING